jgi:predicted metal-dependent hydrolase
MQSLLHPLHHFEIPVHTRISARAKRIILRADPSQQRIELVYPKRTSKKQAEAFLAKQQLWIHQQIARWEPVKRFTPGTSVPILGKSYEITLLTDSLRGTPVVLDDATGKLYVRGDTAHVARRVKDYLKKRCKETASELLTHYSAQLGVTYRKMLVRDTISRWGSCSSDGTISLCWRLIMMPEKVFAYVVAHEVAHLKEMNHSLEFWKHVAMLEPEFKAHRAWLKVHGGKVHGWE